MSNNWGNSGAHRSLTERSTADETNEHGEASKAVLSRKDGTLQKDQNGEMVWCHFSRSKRAPDCFLAHAQAVKA